MSPPVLTLGIPQVVETLCFGQRDKDRAFLQVGRAKVIQADDGHAALAHGLMLAVPKQRHAVADADVEEQLGAMRERVQAIPTTDFARDEIEVTLVLDAGERVGSGRYRGVSPMTDADLEHKLRAQAATLPLPPARIDALVAALRALPGAPALEALSPLL